MAPAAQAAPPPGVRLRPGRAADRPAIIRGILREKLNPLSVDPARFIVAERESAEERGSTRLVGFGQVKPLGGGALELATLVVEEMERGKGVGGALIRSLIAQAGAKPLYLTTITSRAALYKRFGFEEVARHQVPSFLQLEYLLGLAVAWLATRERLVLMRLAAAGAAATEGQEQQQQQRQEQQQEQAAQQ